jgi:hypothetical protein
MMLSQETTGREPGSAALAVSAASASAPPTAVKRLALVLLVG